MGAATKPWGGESGRWKKSADLREERKLPRFLFPGQLTQSTANQRRLDGNLSRDRKPQEEKA